jgi:hypothetical protein
MQVILNIENPQDWTALLPILERLNISIQATLPMAKKKKRPTVKNLAYHQAVIAKGGDATYFGDAAQWQREQRKERDLLRNCRT